MRALAGANLDISVSYEGVELQDLSGSITSIETEIPSDGLMKTHITLINTPEGIHETKTLGKVIIKCMHCGQWAAKKTSCKHCGGPV